MISPSEDVPNGMLSRMTVVELMSLSSYQNLTAEVCACEDTSPASWHFPGRSQ